MFSKSIVALALAGSALAQFSISTPASLIECEPALIAFTGSTNTPFVLAAIPGGEVSAAAIEYIDSDLPSSPYTWTVNLASGTNITLKLTDSTGAIAYSSPVVIQAGADSTCLNATASTSGLSTAAVTTTDTAVSSTQSGTTSVAGATTSTTSVAAASSAASSAAASSAAASSAAASSAASSAGVVSSAAAAVTSSAAAVATSAVADATSAAAAATSAAASAGKLNAVIGVPAVFAGLFGLAALL